MKPVDIARSFKRKVSQEISLEAEGLDRFIVYTPFQFDDGDHYVVVLKRFGDNWLLTDEGHTFMHLSYSEVDLSAGTRAKIIDQALSAHHVHNDSGELRLTIPGKDFGDALFSFVQALGQIAHTAKWTRDVVKSTFADDLAAIIETTLPLGSVIPNFADPKIDPSGEYHIDFKITTSGKPWFLFGIQSDAQCKDATITCYYYEKNRYNFNSIAFYEDQSLIPRRSVAQLTNVVGKQFSSLAERDRIKNYLQTEIAAQPS